MQSFVLMASSRFSVLLLHILWAVTQSRRSVTVLASVESSRKWTTRRDTHPLLMFRYVRNHHSGAEPGRFRTNQVQTCWAFTVLWTSSSTTRCAHGLGKRLVPCCARGLFPALASQAERLSTSFRRVGSGVLDLLASAPGTRRCKPPAHLSLLSSRVPFVGRLFRIHAGRGIGSGLATRIRSRFCGGERSVGWMR